MYSHFHIPTERDIHADESSAGHPPALRDSKVYEEDNSSEDDIAGHPACKKQTSGGTEEKDDNDKEGSAAFLIEERSFLVDAGTSYHLISKFFIRKEKRTIRKLEEPVPLRTADGVLYAEEAVTVTVRDLAMEKVEALI